MYIRTTRALVWVESPLEQPQTANQSTPAPRVPYQERWAKKPLNTNRARCVAVRQYAGKLELGCMINNRLIWLHDPQQVLKEWQLGNWLREGF